MIINAKLLFFTSQVIRYILLLSYSTLTVLCLLRLQLETTPKISTPKTNLTSSVPVHFLIFPPFHFQIANWPYLDDFLSLQLLPQWQTDAEKQQSQYQLDLASQSQQAQVKSRRLLKAIREQNSDLKFYSWDFKENYTYITYLKNFRHIFDSHEQRKRSKVFNHISKLLITRNPHQIKSHHQKMMMRHKSIEDIIDYLRIKIIKYLKGSPESAQDIERINEYCEAFFLRESALRNKLREKERQDKEIESEKELEGLNGSQGQMVKQQDGKNEQQYESIKNTQNLNESPKTCDVKVEEGTERLYHVAK